ncbi:MAG: rhamnulokinase [Treponema sp.]|jgi:rhamnulokinase|nr:rhamnulokinase [Treponema sp.]
MAYFLAVDIGASGGRHMLGWVEEGKIRTEEAYRFENRPFTRDGRLCWDAEGLFRHILAGLRACKSRGKIPDTMGIDTWGVDFVLLDSRGERIGDALSYRDGRVRGMAEELERSLPFSELYAQSGIQKQAFNTIYQLMALKKQNPDYLERARNFLMMPDYFHYLLSGVKKQEYTNATTTALVRAGGGGWNYPLIDTLALPSRLFGELSGPGTPAGRFLPQVREEAGFDCSVMLPATHDTASAFLAVPARDGSSVCLSSGTWSLLGVETAAPLITPAAREANFTNEGGYGGSNRFLKNIMGLWIIQSIKRELGDAYSYAGLEAAAREAGSFASVVDAGDEVFLAPESMTGAVRDFCSGTGQPVPQTPGELARCVYAGLAACYADSIRQLSAITGKDYAAVRVVGGGSRDRYLNSLTAAAAGIPVFAGPEEGTAAGNLLAQMIAAGEFRDAAEAREAVALSFDIVEYVP